jgi:hypothetical protein
LPLDASSTEERDKEAAHGKHEKNDPNTLDNP